MAATEYYNLLDGPHGRQPSEANVGYYDEVADPPPHIPLVPAHYFGPDYVEPQGTTTGGYIEGGKEVTAPVIVDLT